MLLPHFMMHNSLIDITFYCLHFAFNAFYFLKLEDICERELYRSALKDKNVQIKRNNLKLLAIFRSKRGQWVVFTLKFRMKFESSNLLLLQNLSFSTDFFIMKLEIMQKLRPGFYRFSYNYLLLWRYLHFLEPCAALEHQELRLCEILRFMYCAKFPPPRKPVRYPR